MTTPTHLPVAPAPRRTVYDLIAAWALHARRGELGMWAIGGALDVLGIALVRPGWWLAAMPFACFASIGVWGLASQRLLVPGTSLPSPRRQRLLRVAKIAATTVGTIAAVATFFGALWLVFGTRWGPSGG